VLETAALHVPTVARALRTTRFRALADRPIVALFDLEVLEPARLRMRARTGRPGVGVPPGAQLATFRAMSDDGVLDDAALERQMTRWLVELGKTRLRSPAAAAPTRPGNRHVQ
jgi:hypothetical protein